MPRIITYILTFQGIYFLTTGLWGILDVNSFMDVTGPKNDVWLVRSVGALIVSISLAFFTDVLLKINSSSIKVLGLTSSLALGSIDYYYVCNDEIDEIYLWDAFLQSVFFIIWLRVFLKSKTAHR